MSKMLDQKNTAHKAIRAPFIRTSRSRVRVRVQVRLNDEEEDMKAIRARARSSLQRMLIMGRLVRVGHSVHGNDAIARGRSFEDYDGQHVMGSM